MKSNEPRAGRPGAGDAVDYLEGVREMAARYEAVLVDYWCFEAFHDPRMWDADRLHFSPLGHHTIAAMVRWSAGAPGEVIAVLVADRAALVGEQATTLIEIRREEVDKAYRQTAQPNVALSIWLWG